VGHPVSHVVELTALPGHLGEDRLRDDHESGMVVANAESDAPHASMTRLDFLHQWI